MLLPKLALYHYRQENTIHLCQTQRKIGDDGREESNNSVVVCADVDILGSILCCQTECCQLNSSLGLKFLILSFRMVYVDLPHW